ncbi:MAG TPA: hypothetical protein VL020_06025 [Pseudomonadales bacterium]|nr:hypothetical protein [Pseudomonadales bacterium]
MRKVFTEDFIKELEVDVTKKSKSFIIYTMLDKGPSLKADINIFMLFFKNPLKFRRFTSNINSAVNMVKYVHPDADFSFNISGYKDERLSYIALQTRKQGLFREHGFNPCVCLMKALMLVPERK